MSKVRRGVVALVAEKYTCQLIAVITLAAMSRILTPAETGIYLIANTVIMLSENLRMFGVGIFIVQEHDLKNEIVRSVFTINLLMSLTIALGIYLSSGAISSYFAEPELVHLLSVAVIAFVIAPFGGSILSLMQRDLLFSNLAVLNVICAIITAIVTISLGVLGFGPVSYVWGFVASSVALVAGAIYFRPEFWLFRPSLFESRRILKFGVISSSVTVLNMAYDMLPRLALGRILGVDAVGLYARAVTVCQLPDRALVSALQPIVLPAMAAQTRAGGNLKHSYLRGHALMSAIQWPTLIMLALLADPVVGILLGAQWGETAPLVRVIALSTMALAPAFMTFPLLVSLGRIRDTLWSSLICLPPSMLIVIVSANISLSAVAYSLLIIAPMQMYVALIFVRRAIDLSWSDLFVASRRSVFLSLGTAAVPLALILVSSNGFDLSFGETLIAILGGAIGWFLMVIFTDHPIKGEVLAVLEMMAQTRWCRNFRAKLNF
ncbi:Membrane protein involved in the export of O-antigen and teichoic acid [Jannaschia faecimaris]|uniref:Membrane protein involved in the export of O-antigen and teichoic acid n=1 Tax=Jannaschia faecimaris TaxID=1244108 RepID=A0A1H3UE18_9RHOB|nr:oligosaccharide flippase family protein [Jannaschia faecimaris]SDZ60105.1 Membrane protein involved in the export of O-antigen and teichoic acid [Jannaschia faecimaris]